MFATLESRYLRVGAVSEPKELLFFRSLGAGALPPFAIAPIMVSIWQGLARV